MIEAALFQLGVVLQEEQLDQMQMAASIFARALGDAKTGGVNAARVNDLAFALNDLIAAADDSGAPPNVVRIILMLQGDVARLRAGAQLPPHVIAMVRDFQGKLRTRRGAVERNTYRPEDTPEAALPHPPEELCGLAIPLREMLYASGFTTPALDTLIDDPASLRYHSLGDIIDELDVIAAGG